jgi:hypothetical protein
VAAFAPHEMLVLLGYLVAGVGISVFFPKLYDDAAKFPGRRGVALTWLRSGSSLMSLVIPTTVGVLAASRLSVGAATAIVTLPCIVGFFGLTFRRPPDRDRVFRRSTQVRTREGFAGADK